MICTSCARRSVGATTTAAIAMRRSANNFSTATMKTATATARVRTALSRLLGSPERHVTPAASSTARAGRRILSPSSSVRAASTTTGAAGSSEGAAASAAASAAARLARQRQQHALQTESMERVRAHYKIKNRTTMYVLYTHMLFHTHILFALSTPSLRFGEQRGGDSRRSLLRSSWTEGISSTTADY